MSDLWNNLPQHEGLAEIENDQTLAERQRISQLVVNVLIAAIIFPLECVCLQIIRSLAIMPILLLTAVLSFLYVAARSGGIFGAYPRTYPRTFILGIGLFPGLFATLVNLKIFNFTNLHPLVFAIVLAGLALMLFAAAIDRTARSIRSITLGSLVLSLCYGGAIVATGNAALDSKPISIVRASVVESFISSGRGGVTYHVTLAPWEAAPKGESLRVTKENAARASEDGFICMSLHAGGLGVQWYRIDPCGITAPKSKPGQVLSDTDQSRGVGASM